MPKDLSIRVRSELYKRDMKHKDLADMLDISGAYLSDILSGKRNGARAQEHVKHIKKILNL